MTDEDKKELARLRAQIKQDKENQAELYAIARELGITDIRHARIGDLIDLAMARGGALAMRADRVRSKLPRKIIVPKDADVTPPRAS